MVKDTQKTRQLEFIIAPFLNNEFRLFMNSDIELSLTYSYTID